MDSNGDPEGNYSIVGLRCNNQKDTYDCNGKKEFEPLSVWKPLFLVGFEYLGSECLLFFLVFP